LSEKYQGIWPEVKKALADYSDVLDGSLLMCEYGGISFNWPLSSVKDAATGPKSAATFAEAESNCVAILRQSVDDARKNGLPPPYISIEPTYGTAPFLFRGGIDRVDVEVIYGNDLERRFAGIVGATRAFGRSAYGADMAMVWYGGNQHDALWESRWRTSLYHAWLRGADPVYAEHGIMDYRGLGKRYDVSHPDVARFRRVLGEFAAWAKRQPRAEGLPQTAVAAIQGRFDGFVGGWQTNLWGQRRNEAWRIGAPERAWEIFDGLYQRRRWEDRYKWGERDYSGNPPLGQADILPYDADAAKWKGYKTLFFLGRNSMDEALHSKLVGFVRGGGTLLLSACHLDTADRPGEAFKPFRGGDWRELTGLKMVPGKESRMPYGIKFTAAPPGWNFTLWGPVCDPWFTDGGFRMPVLENFGATALALTSEAFADPVGFDPKAVPVLYSHRIGAGTVVFLASLDSPGGPNVRPLYEHLVARALDATPVWPKVDCSERVRWAVYPGGRMYFLNTEEDRAEEVVVKMSPAARPVRFTLAAGAFRELERSEMKVTLSFDDGLKEHLTTIAPMLEKRGWRGIFGVVPKLVGKNGVRLDWDDCRELMRRGHEVALHGYSHANLADLVRERRFDEIRREIRLGVEAMERNLGDKPKLFIAPYSAAPAEAERIIREEGLALLPTKRRNFGCDTPAGTPAGVGAYLDGRAAAGETYGDVLVHGIDGKSGAWRAFGDVGSFERHLDEIASRRWVKVVVGDEARKAFSAGAAAE
jgi:peptidoglycan/xylan/chitin deacetylase (PgdA/CDA1 family)